jgi:hypothetical protein
MRKSIFQVIIGFFFLPVAAQKADSIIGKWNFLAIAPSSYIDSTGGRLAKIMFTNLMFYFKENNHYKMVMMDRADEGNWWVDSSNTKIIAASNEGSIIELAVIKLKADTLVVSMGDHKTYLILTRSSVTEKDKEEAHFPVMESVSATANQITRKWFLKRSESPNKTEEQLKKMELLLKGSYFHFKTNGSYASKILAPEQEGKWTFGPDNKSLILSTDREKKVWNIKFIGNNEMRLRIGNTKEVWIFSVQE